MRKLAIMLVLFLVPFRFCLGQETISVDSAEMDQIINFITNRYIKAYLEIHHPQSPILKKLTDNCKLDKNANVWEIMDDCQKDKKIGNIVKEKIFTPIRNCQDLNKATAIPNIFDGESEDTKSRLNSVKQEIDSEITQWLSNKRKKDTPVNTDNDKLHKLPMENFRLNEKIKQLEATQNQDGGFSSTEIILLSIALLELIAIIYFVICWEKKTEEDEESGMTGNEQLQVTRKHEQKIGELNAEINKLRRKIDELTKNCKTPQKDSQQKQTSNSVASEPIKATTSPSKPDTEKKKEPVQVIKHDYTGYLAQFDGESFGRLKDKKDLCNFAIFNKKTDSAKFEYCGDDNVAIAQYDVVFDGIADWEGDPQNASSVQLITPGEVRFIDERWKVTTKAKIKFE